MLDLFKRIFNRRPKGPPVVRKVQFRVLEINPRYLQVSFGLEGGHTKVEYISTPLIRRVEEVKGWTVGSGKSKDYTWYLKVYAADLRDPIAFTCPITNNEEESKQFQEELLKLRGILVSAMVEANVQ